MLRGKNFGFLSGRKKGRRGDWSYASPARPTLPFLGQTCYSDFGETERQSEKKGQELLPISARPCVYHAQIKRREEGNFKPVSLNSKNCKNPWGKEEGKQNVKIWRRAIQLSFHPFFRLTGSGFRYRMSRNVNMSLAQKRKKKCNEEPWILTLNFSTSFPFPIIRATIFSSLEFVQEEFKLFEVRKRY